jgi:hypothetical protein
VNIRLLLWPTIITALVSTARLIAEVRGWISAQSGGALNPLGISWLALLFGGYFAIHLSRNGSRPRVQRAWLWAIVAFAAVTVSVGWQFGPFLEADQSEATFEKLRGAMLLLMAITTTTAIALLLVWPRLVWTMLCYALPARLLVVAFTWLAKHFEWSTHYTKFGPSGIERDMGDTMLSAALAQGGFWIPWTIVAGCLTGSFFAKRR